MIHIDAQALADRYISLWTEPDARLRRSQIEALWAAKGRHVLQPPQQFREIAAELGFDHTTLEAHGYDAIETRVLRSYDSFVAGGAYTFRARRDAVRLHDTVHFTWEMTDLAQGTVAGGGREVLVLAEDGLISVDYMFPGL
ncbi:hypothetical protein Raf01_81940 [Rugosimonospora africana]|uniref:SnoaL-like domain-containing protein n=2 Tax=Rugosimonospora africana TaxID=556532 RepID=A0A8J3VUW5_9ACTN|nr:hypothetical protein Raf01_81940 [Rugosimonospora africana]